MPMHFESDRDWTVVRGSDLKEGPSEGLPVWSEHVGDPVLASNRTRRVFAQFMVAPENSARRRRGGLRGLGVLDGLCAIGLHARGLGARVVHLSTALWMIRCLF